MLQIALMILMYDYSVGVWEKEQSYVPQYMVDEMEGIAAGVCAKMDLLNPTTTQEGGPGLPTVPACNVTEWSLKVKQLNMLPELIRMACTAYGIPYIHTRNVHYSRFISPDRCTITNYFRYMDALYIHKYIHT